MFGLILRVPRPELQVLGFELCNPRGFADGTNLLTLEGWLSRGDSHRGLRECFRLDPKE